MDFVRLHPGTQRPDLCIEVKWSDGPYDHVSELDKAVDFVWRNNLSRLFVTTRTQQGVRRSGNVEIVYVPTSFFAYAMPDILTEKQAPQA